jgi:hypothetical protein
MPMPMPMPMPMGSHVAALQGPLVPTDAASVVVFRSGYQAGSARLVPTRYFNELARLDSLSLTSKVSSPRLGKKLEPAPVRQSTEEDPEEKWGEEGSID